MSAGFSWRCAWLEGGSRESPRRARYLFFASPKKSTQKKGAPQSATPSLRYGADLRRGNRTAQQPHAPLLRPAPLSQRVALAPARTGPSEAMARMDVCWVPFCACREAQGRGCVRVPKDTRTSCTDSPQLFERSAAGAQRVLRWHPLTEHRRLPRSAAKGTRAAGSPSPW